MSVVDQCIPTRNPLSTIEKLLHDRELAQTYSIANKTSQHTSKASLEYNRIQKNGTNYDKLCF